MRAALVQIGVRVKVFAVSGVAAGALDGRRGVGASLKPAPPTAVMSETLTATAATAEAICGSVNSHAC